MNKSPGHEPALEMLKLVVRTMLARRGLWGLGLGLLFYDARLLRGAR